MDKKWRTSLWGKPVVTKVSCKMGCISASVAMNSRKEVIPCHTILVNLLLDFWAWDHKDMALWSEAHTGPESLGAGAHAYQEKPQELVCPALRREGERDFPLLSAPAVWDSGEKTEPGFSWRCRIGWEATKTHCNMCNWLRIRNLFVFNGTMMVPKHWNRLSNDAVGCPSLARGIQNPTGRGPEQPDVVWTGFLQQLACMASKGLSDPNYFVITAA